jgi:hypothetical protein
MQRAAASALLRRERVESYLSDSLNPGGFEVRQGRIVSCLLALFLPMLLARPVYAQGATAADCLITVSVHLSPAVSLSPTSGTETTGGETGSIACSGAFDGHRVTGNGTFGYEGIFTGITCLSDTTPLSGTYSLTVPTDAGPLHFSGHITDARIAAVDRFDLSQTGAHFTGTAAVVPIVGTCFVIPTTDILITMLGSFRPTPPESPAMPTETATSPPTNVLGSSFSRQPSLPVTGTTDFAFLGLLTAMCYLLGGFALTWSRKRP